MRGGLVLFRDYSKDDVKANAEGVDRLVHANVEDG